MVQIRELQIRLNRGDVLVRYRAEGVGTQRIRVGWWVVSAVDQYRKLGRIERLIVETMLHSAIKHENRL